MISIPIYTKSVLATVLLGLALLQFAAIGMALGWFGAASITVRRRLRLLHRVEGYAALLPRIGLTLLAAVIAVWLSSAAWFFIQYYTGLFSGN